MAAIKKGICEHYKGKRYRVLGVARHSETLDELVVYKALYKSKEFGSNAIWVRPTKMFAEKVRVNGKVVPRFKFLKKE
ncbi:MAG: DUF1653 domain-containing protein [Candidatus Micrarchaeota archaeon]|nr:DUF1653 domain-containing protein [Candidatus Micrarchaeota archaeon]